MVALMTGLSGPSIIENAIDRLNNFASLNPNPSQEKPKDKKNPEPDPPTQRNSNRERTEEQQQHALAGAGTLGGKEDELLSNTADFSDPVEPGNIEKRREKTVTRALGRDDDQKLKDEYERLEKKRESLEKKRAEYEMRTRELESRLRLSRTAYMRCASGKWQISYKAHLDDAENSRKRLEERNKQLVKLNSELRKRNSRFERERRGIEKKHIIKGEEYKDEMRNWMDRIEAEYFFDLENRLFRGYEEYQHGIDLYMIGIDGAAEACRKVDLTSRSMETFISFVRELH